MILGIKELFYEVYIYIHGIDISLYTMYKIKSGSNDICISSSCPRLKSLWNEYWYRDTLIIDRTDNHKVFIVFLYDFGFIVFAIQDSLILFLNVIFGIIRHHHLYRCLIIYVWNFYCVAKGFASIEPFVFSKDFKCSCIWLFYVADM